MSAPGTSGRRRLAVAAFGGALILAGCGGGDDAAPSPSSAGSTVTTSPSPSTPPSGPASSAPASSPPILPAGASAEQIAAAARSVLGPSDNVVAELTPFLDVPTEIPTPRGAIVNEFGVSAGFQFINDREAKDFGAGKPHRVATSKVVFSTPASAADLVSFYEAAMPAAGYELIGAASDDVETLQFDIPGTDFSWSVVRVLIVGAGAAGDGVTSVTVEVTDRTSPDVIALLDGWPGEIPAVPDRETVSVSVSAPVLTGPSYDQEVVDLYAQYRVPGTLTKSTVPDAQIRDLRAQVKTALPTAEYRHRPVKEPADEVGVCAFKEPIGVHRDGLRRATLSVGRGVEARPTRFESGSDDRTFIEVATCAEADLGEFDRGPAGEDGQSSSVETVAPTTTAAQPTAAPLITAPPPVDGGLQAHATVQEILASADRTLGPTDDVGAALARYLALPVALPTPRDAEITEFSVNQRRGVESTYPYDGRLTINTSGTPTDVLTFFEANLAATGLVRTAGGEKTAFDPVRYVVFETPQSTEESAAAGTIEVQVPADSTERWARIWFRGESPSPDLLERLDEWPGEIPGVQGHELTSVSLSSPLTTIVGHRDGISLGAGYDVPDTTAGRLVRTIRKALPSDLYRSRSYNARNRTFTLTRPGFDAVTIQASETSEFDFDTGGSHPVGRLTVSGAVPTDSTS